eukprot:329464_1
MTAKDGEDISLKNETTAQLYKEEFTSSYTVMMFIIGVIVFTAIGLSNGIRHIKNDETELGIYYLVINGVIALIFAMFIPTMFRLIIEDKGNYLDVSVGPLNCGNVLCNMQNEQIKYEHIEKYRRPNGSCEQRCGFGVGVKTCNGGCCKILRIISLRNRWRSPPDRIVIEYKTNCQ